MINPKMLKTYSDFVSSTYATGMSTGESIANCILSMCGELAEWAVSEIRSKDELLEAGDVLYYITQLIRELGVPLELLLSQPPIELQTPMDMIAVLADLTKKHLFWGDSPKYNRQDYTGKILPTLSDIIAAITLDRTLEEIITANTEKLSIRRQVPNPFTEV